MPTGRLGCCKAAPLAPHARALNLWGADRTYEFTWSWMRTQLPTRPRHLARRGRSISIALALVTGLVGATLAGSQPAAARTVSHARTTYEAQIAEKILGQINVERHAHHLKALRMSRALQRSARRHDITMSTFNTMSHQLPSEARFGTRMRVAGYHWKWAGENIAWNSQMNIGGVRHLESRMYHERPPNDGHRRNILSSHFRDVGVDVYIDRTHRKVWLTTDFGKR